MTVSRISHGRNIRRTYCFVKYRAVPKLSEAAKVERQERILEGARRCFARHGYEGATVVRLEEEIGLSRGAIFNWFDSKQELFLALAARDNERLLTVFADEGLEAILEALLTDDPDWLAVYLEFGRRMRTDAELRERWKTIAPEDARERTRGVDRGRAGRAAPPVGRLGAGDRAVSRRHPRRDRRAARPRFRCPRARVAPPLDAGRDRRCALSGAGGSAKARHRGTGLHSQLVGVGVGVDALDVEDLVHVASGLRELDPDTLAPPLVDVPLARVVGGERGSTRRRSG